MLDPFVDGRSGVAGTAAPRSASPPSATRRALRHRPRLFLGLKAPAIGANIRAALERAGRRLSRQQQDQRRSGGARQPRSRGAHRGLRRRPRLSPLARQCRRLALAGGGTNWSLANGLGGGKSDAFQAASTAPPNTVPPISPPPSPSPTTGCDRPLRRRRPVTAASTRRATAGGSRAAIASRHGTAASHPMPRSRRRASPPPAKRHRYHRRGFGLAYNSRTGTDTGRARHPLDRVLALIPMPYFRCGPGSPGRTTGSATRCSHRVPGASGRELHRRPPRRRRTPRWPRPAPSFASPTGSRCSASDGEFASHSSTYAGTGAVRYTS